MAAFIPICITDKLITIGYHNYLLPLYFKDGVLDFSIDQLGYDHGTDIKVILNFDLKSMLFKVYVAELSGGSELAIPYSVSAGEFLKAFGLIFNDDHIVQELYSAESSLVSFIREKYDDLSAKINNLNVDVDFTPINTHLDQIANLVTEINSKISIMQIADLTKIIDDKLGQLFHMPSLNGSNGAKYKDGEEVPVSGYDGLWKIEGSYPMLNSEGATIVVYKLTKDDRVLLAPSVFVGVSDTAGGS